MDHAESMNTCVSTSVYFWNSATIHMNYLWCVHAYTNFTE